ncbi:substrate-binding periplasmic protein [Marinobacter bohaiensis]|uniref:substrate-binding periplasmic protein n=1 Tax=Marinobacter bohaiensis TaxID=2201898 RepID=UPI0013A6D44F|nr:transporter substrate-binding domain-containing protein [Marinobacter bohaiensis]
MNLTALLRLAALALVLGSASVYATDADEPAIFAIPEVWPWGYAGRYGSPEGSLVDLAHQLVTRADLPVKYELRPHRRAITELLRGEVDFVVLFESPRLADEAIDLGPVVTTRAIMTGLRSSDVVLTLEGLRGKPVAFVHGTYYGEAFARAQGIHKFAVRDIFQALEMLKLGRVSAILCSDQAIYHTLASLDLSPEDFRMRNFRAGQEGHLYMSRRALHPELEDEMRAALESLRQDGTLDSIFALPGNTSPLNP